MNKLDKAIAYIAPRRAAIRAKARYQIDLLESRAGYDGAGKGRRNTWVRGPSTSQNTESKAALSILRGNYRELVRNDAYASSALDTIVSNTIGEGIMPVAKHASSPYKAKLAQELMHEWMQSLDCDAAGCMNLFGLQSLAMRTESESGEAVVLRQIKRHKKVRVPLALRLVEADFIDDFRDGTVEGMATVQGVSFVDNAPAYVWLHNNHPGDQIYTSGGSKKVSASEVARMYEVRRPGQVRGLPRGVSAMSRMRNLGEMQDAILEQQKIAACLVGVITQGEEGKAAGDPLPEKLEPGLFARLGVDEDVAFNSPPSLSGQDAIIRKEEHMIARAWGINYQALTGDLSNANFANGKIGRLDMYTNIRRLRANMVVPMFCKPVADWFLQAAAIAGFDLDGVTFDWNPPRTEILNLRDDIPAIIKQVRAGLGSMSGVLRSMGYADPEVVLRELAEDFELFDELKLVLDTDPRKTTNSGQMQSTGVNTSPVDIEESEESEEENAD